MTANAAVVVGVNIAAERCFILFYLEYCILGTVDNAVITLKAHASAHAAVCLLLCGVTIQTCMAFSKVAEHFIRIRSLACSQITRCISEMGKKQLV